MSTDHKERPAFSSENQPTPEQRAKGRRPKIKGIPADAQQKVYAALYHALTLPDQATAMDYLSRRAKQLPEFGYLIQIYAKGMMGKNGILYVGDILDRLFGKPIQSQELHHDLGEFEPPVIVFREKKKDGEGPSPDQVGTKSGDQVEQ